MRHAALLTGYPDSAEGSVRSCYVSPPQGWRARRLDSFGAQKKTPRSPRRAHIANRDLILVVLSSH